ncbi:MAG: KEOPS complex subunit Pcc1 [Methanobacteriaceae archaeon]
MQITARLTFHYQKEEQARIAYQSLEPDNRNYLESEVINNDFICVIRGESVPRVLATLDDLIFSEILVEKVLKIDGDKK